MVLLLILAGIIVLLLLNIRFKNVGSSVLIHKEKAQPYLLLSAGIFIISLATYSSLFIYQDIFPENASSHGQLIEDMFFVTLLFTGVVFVGTQFLLFYFPFKYGTKEGRKAFHFPNNFKIEILWTAIPFMVFVFLFAWGNIIWNKIHSPLNNPIEIEIVAEQFNWFVRYPGKDGKFGSFNINLMSQENNLGINLKDKNSHDDFIPVQLHIPKNRGVKIHLRSKDVIHSMNIPNMKVKMDAVPGMPTTASFIATLTTKEMRAIKNDEGFNYEMSCAELCGRMHFAMQLIVVVEEEKEFEEWYASQTPWVKYTEDIVNTKNL